MLRKTSKPRTATESAPANPPGVLENDEMGTVDATLSLLDQLATEIATTGTADSLPVVQSIPGTVVVWITDNAVETSTAQAKGYHLPMRGDGYILNEELFKDTESGYLCYGDAIPAVVRADVWAKKLKDDYDSYMIDVEGSGSSLIGKGTLSIERAKAK